MAQAKKVGGWKSDRSGTRRSAKGKKANLVAKKPGSGRGIERVGESKANRNMSGAGRTGPVRKGKGDAQGGRRGGATGSQGVDERAARRHREDQARTGLPMSDVLEMEERNEPGNQ